MSFSINYTRKGIDTVFFMDITPVRVYNYFRDEKKQPEFNRIFS